MRNLTIGKRITLGFTVLLVLISLFAVSSLYQSRKVGIDVQMLTQDNLPGIRLTSELVAETLRYRVINLKHIISTNAAEMNALDQSADEETKKILTKLTVYRKSVQDGEEKLLAERIEPLLHEFSISSKNMRALSLEFKKDEAGAQMKNEVSKSYAEYEKSVEACKAFNEKEATESSTKVESTLASSKIAALSVFGLALVLGIGSALLITRSVNKALREISTTLADGASQVAAASGEIAAASQSLAEGASEQAASLEETSATLEEMSAMTRRNAESATNGSDLGRQTKISADAGLNRINEMGQTLVSVKSAVGEMESAVTEMKNSSQEISKIIKTIDEIAFQTNILALNAAVEAARAGEAGSGFAVVADEVRALAQRSAQAAKDTSEKIEAAIKRSELGGVASAKVVQSLGQIENNAADIGQVFQGIVGQVAALDAVITQIAAASQEQSQGTAEVNVAVSQMDKVTMTNAASAEESAGASEELSGQAESLRDAVMDMQKLIGGVSISKPNKRSASANRIKTSPAAPAKQAKKTAQAAADSNPTVTPRLASPRTLRYTGNVTAQSVKGGSFEDF